MKYDAPSLWVDEFFGTVHHTDWCATTQSTNQSTHQTNANLMNGAHRQTTNTYIQKKSNSEQPTQIFFRPLSPPLRQVLEAKLRPKRLLHSTVM